MSFLYVKIKYKYTISVRKKQLILGDFLKKQEKNPSCKGRETKFYFVLLKMSLPPPKGV